MASTPIYNPNWFVNGISHKNYNKLAELNLSGYSAKMIMNRAEAMSCSGCHQNSRYSHQNHARSKSLKPLMNLNLDSLHQQKAQPMGWI
jgi:cell division protein FtsI/penicillin-binding protein 2